MPEKIRTLTHSKAVALSLLLLLLLLFLLLLLLLLYWCSYYRVLVFCVLSFKLYAVSIFLSSFAIIAMKTKENLPILF